MDDMSLACVAVLHSTNAPPWNHSSTRRGARDEFHERAFGVSHTAGTSSTVTRCTRVPGRGGTPTAIIARRLRRYVKSRSALFESLVSPSSRGRNAATSASSMAMPSRKPESNSTPNVMRGDHDKGRVTASVSPRATAAW